MFVLEKIAEYAKENGKIALVHNDNTMTYAELESRSNAFANYLLDNGKNKSPVVIFIIWLNLSVSKIVFNCWFNHTSLPLRLGVMFSWEKMLQNL